MKLLRECPDIKAVIFDLDGTLLDSMHIWQEIDREYLAQYNIDFNPLLSEKIKHMSFNESARYFIETFHLPKTEEEIKRDWNRMAERQYRDCIPLKDGAKSFLQELQKANIKMALATSCIAEHAQMALKRLEIDAYFSTIQFCLQLGKNKEHPDVFLECAKKMRVSVKECVVIEDLYVALQVAKQAGFHTVGIYDILSVEQEEQMRSLCDYYIHSFKELI